MGTCRRRRHLVVLMPSCTHAFGIVPLRRSELCARPRPLAGSSLSLAGVRPRVHHLNRTAPADTGLPAGAALAERRERVLVWLCRRAQHRQARGARESSTASTPRGANRASSRPAPIGRAFLCRLQPSALASPLQCTGAGSRYCRAHSHGDRAWTRQPLHRRIAAGWCRQLLCMTEWFCCRYVAPALKHPVKHAHAPACTHEHASTHTNDRQRPPTQLGGARACAAEPRGPPCAGCTARHTRRRQRETRRTRGVRSLLHGARISSPPAL
jgi:hypothetical protein